MLSMKRLRSFFILLVSSSVFAQQVPSKFENIESLVVFSQDAKPIWGDDDHVQVNFFSLPKGQRNPIYIRIFDPNVGGKFDQVNGVFNSKTKFSIYGGKGCYSDKKSRQVNPVKGFKTGVLLNTKTFDQSSKYDGVWYTFGPFNPQEGEFDTDLDAYVFKIIAEGIDGDDGNIYKYFLSNDNLKNRAVEGGNSFCYELSIRLKKSKIEIAHFYPFINNQIISVEQHNFDFDNNGNIRLTSLIKKSHEMNVSGDGNWSVSIHKVSEEEHNTSLDIHIINKKEFNNDMTIYLLDQYKNAIPFFSIPIGGVPKYKYKIDVQYQFD